MYRIAVNTVLMNLRRRKTPPVSLDGPVSSESPSLRRDIGRTDLRLSGAIDRIALRRAMLGTTRRMPKDFSPCTRLKDTSIRKSPKCWTAQSRLNSKSQLNKARMKMRGLLFPKRRVLRRAEANPVTESSSPEKNNPQPQLSLSVWRGKQVGDT